MSKRFLNTALLGLAVVILLALFLKTVGLFDSKIKTYPATLGNLVVDLEKDGLVFRDEVLVSANTQGKVDYLVEEAQRVYAGQPIAILTPSSGKAQEQTQEAGKEEPAKTKDGKPDFSAHMIDIEAIRSNIRSLEDELSYLVKQNKYAEIEDVRKRLSSFYLVQQAYQNHGGFAVIPPAVSASLEGGRYNITAPKPGLIGLETSAYDQLFALPNIHLIQYNTLPTLPESTVKREVKEGDVILRIVDNKNSFLVVELTSEEMAYFKQGNLSDIMIGEDKVTAEIYQLIHTEQQTGIVFRIFEDYPKMTEYRQVKVHLIPEKTQGIIIKATSITEQEGKPGVKILLPSGEVRFMPIKIKAKVGDQVAIHSDYFTLTPSQGANESIKTVSLYDEILEEP